MNSIQRIEHHNFSVEEERLQKIKANSLSYLIDEKDKLTRQIQFYDNKINYLKRMRGLGVNFKVKSDIAKWNRLKLPLTKKVKELEKEIKQLAKY